MDGQKFKDFLEQECTFNRGELRNKTTHRRVRAIIPVHILGHPCDMDPILELARNYNLAVIEDATESLGAKYRERIVGHLGDLACFSFNGNKLITTGGGGMVVTDNPEWARRAKYLTTQAKDDPLEFVHGEIGFNYRLTNIQAALGVAQLERLAEYVAIKRRIATTYTEEIRQIPGLTPMGEAAWASSVFWLYTILVDEMQYGIDSRALLRRLDEHRIQTRPLWQPAHLSPAHRGMHATDCSVAEQLNRTALSLPCSVGLKETEQNRVLEVLRRFSQPSNTGRDVRGRVSG
jgi:perosamine synthetase